jgi:hypothetical protein
VPPRHLGDDSAWRTAFQDNASLGIPREPAPPAGAGYNLDTLQGISLALSRGLKSIAVFMLKSLLHCSAVAFHECRSPVKGRPPALGPRIHAQAAATHHEASLPLSINSVK